MPGDNYLVYDTDCPLCSAYVTMTRLGEAGLNLRLLSARENGELVSRLRSEGLNVDDGMILKMGGTTYFGGDVMNVISLMSSSNAIFNRLNRFLFSNASVARVIYPALRAGRNGLLFLLGRKKVFSE